MNLDKILRDYARQDMRRFYPQTEHSLTDCELAGSLLSAPGLSPRERVAATALDALASFEAMLKRTVEETTTAEETTSPLDMDVDAPYGGLTFDQVRHLWARREVYRRAALVYARMVGDEQLIEHYQTPEPAPELEVSPSQSAASKGTPPKLNEGEKTEILRLYDRGRGESVNALARRFMVSRPTIDKVLKNAGIKK